MARIGVLGGSFNPVHVAHLVLAEWARLERGLDRVLFVPAGQPPHKPSAPLAPAEDRARMVELAIAGNAHFELDRMELRRGGPSYTLTTVRELQRRFGTDARVFLLLGADSVLDLPTWWHARELVREAEVIGLDRPGSDLDEGLPALAGFFGERWVGRVRSLRVRAPQMGISASCIRQRIQSGLSVRYLVPDPVLDYIRQAGLYGSG